MSYTRKFIKDRLLTHDEYYGWQNAIAVIYARWKITNSQYPDGFAYHYFQKELNVDAITQDTFIAIDDVTDEQLEAWCVAGLSDNTIVEIETHNLAESQARHKMAQLTEYYTKPDIMPSP